MENLLYNRLDEYFTKQENIEIMMNILNDSKISLRVIDWFVTNYSKRYNIEYNIYIDKSKKKTLIETKNIYNRINIFIDYKSQLKSYPKKNFDPFCRRERINYKGKLETTMGQLNFFKWSIDNLILEYVIKNYKDIEKDMNNSLTVPEKKAIEGKRKQRKELSKSSYKTLTKRNTKVLLTFN